MITPSNMVGEEGGGRTAKGAAVAAGGGGGSSSSRMITVEQIAKVHSRLDAMLEVTLDELDVFEAECSDHNGATRHTFEVSSDAFLSRVKRAKEVIARPAVSNDDNPQGGLAFYNLGGVESTNTLPPHQFNSSSGGRYSTGCGGEASNSSFTVRSSNSPAALLSSAPPITSESQFGGSPLHRDKSVGFLPSLGGPPYEQTVALSSPMMPSSSHSAAFSQSGTFREGVGSPPLQGSHQQRGEESRHHQQRGSASSPLSRQASVVPLGAHTHSHYVKRLEKVQTQDQQQQVGYQRAAEDRQKKFDNGCYGLYFPHKEGTYADPPPRKAPKTPATPEEVDEYAHLPPKLKKMKLLRRASLGDHHA